MQTVSRFESHLLQIAYCFLGQAPRDEALPLLRQEVKRPLCLSRTAVALLQSALAKGCVRLLARGGWRRERFLRGDQPVAGRLWQRTAPAELGLPFSRNALDFLMWLTARDALACEVGWRPRPHVPLTIGDRFLLFLAYRALRNTAMAERLRRWSPWRGAALCWLAFPDDFAETPRTLALDWECWTSGLGAALFEGLQQELTDHWVRVERGKTGLAAPPQMHAVGRAQKRVLDELFDVLEASRRRDLARFLLAAAARLLRDRPSAGAWLAGLAVAGLTLAQRREVYRAALVFLRSLERLQRWEQEARTVGYFDDGYAAAQLWKADWERYAGELHCGTAQAIVRQADPLQTAGQLAGPSASGG